MRNESLNEPDKAILDYPNTYHGEDEEQDDLARIILTSIAECPALIHEKAKNHGNTGG